MHKEDLIGLKDAGVWLEGPGRSWGGKQTASKDYSTNSLVYKCKTFKDLSQKIKNLSTETQSYITRRWYNFQVEKYILKHFNRYEEVILEDNYKHKTIDLYINAIPFDIKTSVYPYEFNKPFNYALTHKQELGEWLFDNQSKKKEDNSVREHYENRLFIVFYNSCGKHNLLKSSTEFTTLAIDMYLKQFNPKNLFGLPGHDNTLFDVIFVTNV